VEASLSRLGTTYIDLLQIHRFDDETPIEETMEALHDLVKSGKVRYIGASSMWATQFAQMQFCAEKNCWTKFVSMQNYYNLLYREEEREMIRFCNSTGVGIIPVCTLYSLMVCTPDEKQWAPLQRGYLCRPPEMNEASTRVAEEKSWRREDEFVEPAISIVRRVQELAEKKGWKMSQVALAWVNKRVSSPIIGFTSLDEMEEALGARGKVLTEEEEKYLEELYEPRPVIGH
jgi:aryl-alcohol dehydrogenase-like predicted oxidoreductase